MDLKLTPKQMTVLDLIIQGAANEILYGGAAGGGKSHLLRALAIIWSVQVPNLQVFLFRRKVKDLVATHMRGPTSFPVLLKEYEDDKLCRINQSNNYIEFENGSIISLNHCQHEADLTNFLSAEFHVLLIDEATTFTEKMIRFLRARVRIGSLEIPEQLQQCLPFIVYGTNPRGESHLMFKTKFVDAAEPNTVFRAPPNEGGMRRVFVPSLLDDNPYIEKNYRDKLRGLGDPDIVEAYLAGDWSIVEGAAMPSLSRKYHVIHPKYVCYTWPVYRAYDYGFSAPYFVGFYAVATGESTTKFNPPRGSIIFVGMIYGANERDEGLKEDVRKQARRIKEYQNTVLQYTRVRKGPADSSIFDKDRTPNLAEEMEEEGITWEFADKTPGSRIRGLTVIRRYLFQSIFFRYEKPGMYFTTRCEPLFVQLCSIQLDEKNPEDADTKQNDHGFDMVRYVALHKNNEIILAEVQGA